MSAPKKPRRRPNRSTLGLMRLEEVARELDISRASVFKLISAGKLPVIRYGQRMVRVHREDLIAYVEGLRAGEPAARGGRA